MVIKFNFDDEGKGLTFANVNDGQFFIDAHSRLCLKIYSDCFAVMAYADGTPEFIVNESISDRMSVQKVMPFVGKIDF